ncbi:pyrimidine operon attenuation protein / uracil phosphoribosyltransferase [Pseudomonas linyingensis]|uniref:Pyrimidine operon attenuation protein / uracil phosphoribosyltransferase n=1 Tax=Pseudomonas linyingensis TaxID=915471 RepID=A0A1H6UQL3_9PSED|nr:phosphoribosyltransferase family protein [Pseudomonas linyingensis]SEI92007.1 pyrimidine operon attenuation protein / uracil phosphoribosyltransferase [Pseudomonas linyingensis]
MDSKPAGERFRLYSALQLEAVIEQMARQAAALFDGRREVVLVGILRRGEPLAQRLQSALVEHCGLPRWPLYPLHLKRYADDLSLLHAETALIENPELAALDLSRTCLLVVDDVLYEGHSLLRASAWLAQMGALETRTAVLVDRCVNRQPVRADITGLRLQVAPTDIIECNVPPYETEFCIEVLRRALN